MNQPVVRISKSWSGTGTKIGLMQFYSCLFTDYFPAGYQKGPSAVGGSVRRAERSHGYLVSREARMCFGVLGTSASLLFPVSFWTPHPSAHLITRLQNAISKQHRTHTASSSVRANQVECPTDHLASRFHPSSSRLCLFLSQTQCET